MSPLRRGARPKISTSLSAGATYTTATSTWITTAFLFPCKNTDSNRKSHNLYSSFIFRERINLHFMKLVTQLKKLRILSFMKREIDLLSSYTCSQSLLAKVSPCFGTQFRQPESVTGSRSSALGISTIFASGLKRTTNSYLMTT